MKKTNIIFFTGDNRIFLKRELDKWVEIFASKYGDFNISKIGENMLSQVDLVSEILTPPFLGEKRLVVIEGLPKGQKKEDDAASEEEKQDTDEQRILDNLDKIPDSNIIILVQDYPDKRKSLYKKIHEIATVKEYSQLEGSDLKEYIQKRIPHIELGAITKLISYTSGNINLLESEIEKLSLFRMNEKVSEADIEKYVEASIEVSIFSLTDAILEERNSKAYEALDNLLHSHNIHQVFSTILASLRTYLYVHTLSEWGMKSGEIQSTLKIHPFVLEKTLKLAGPLPKMRRLYSRLVDLDRKVKTGEGVGDTDDALRLGLEKEILYLKK